MIHQFYNTLVTCFLIFFIPYLLLRSLFQKRFRRQLTERLGCFPNLSLKKPVWFHATSVGEVFCSIPLLKRIKKEFPNCEIVLTTMTSTGNETAKTYVPEADRVLFLPLDHPSIIHRAVQKISPNLLLLAETELWPNLLRSCEREKIPVILFNGRISQKSFRKYLFLKSFFKECLKSISLFLMQTKEDRDRITEIGGVPDRIKVVGNLKFDQTPPSFNQESANEISNSLGFCGNETILIAGSTHSGEEGILINVFKELKKMDPRLILILAPRHLERLEEVERILRRDSISWKRRTSLNQHPSIGELEERTEVILLDTMGELMSLYSLGTLVFIGGSLVPIGGHNPLEPLFFKKCILFGPHMFNFLEISRRLIEAGGAIQVKDKEALAFQVKRLLSHEETRKEVGEKGYQFLQQHRGATERMFEEIKPYLF